ncbi:MAG: hypothetical protein GTO45_06795 [Candidatus Aminicenantes bacterium]|nr:hypothetical protein [Candidatus Aminicenantes bacterium]NIM78547.1 hypothetical protein [Candidatus Aminicenantes bacterium]NIN17793.1 hypothetical protein [Candidatus Aminicenantes bacterium]NIN41697.1 hypothetical protein [Candidatus Aminicenantes bacterium]NIN84446.1 hypothetical protein [Candidatus Aminicenantes bacterium]
MEILREFKKPVSRQIVLDIPEEYVQKELEILIIPTDNNIQTKKKPLDKKALFDKLCGLWKDRDDVSLETIRNRAWKRN